MRWIFVLLLAANVAYFGWELDRETAIRQRETRSLAAVPVTAQRLKLLQELPEPPSIRTAPPEPEITPAVTPEMPLPESGLVAELPPIVPETAPVISWSCFRYGPLLDQDQLESLQKWFTTRQVEAASTFIEEQGRALFWIYLAPQGSREEAMATLQDMQNKGIGDFRLINRGDLQNAISLGLFSSREAVDARLKELKDKGYVPVVVPYANVKRIYSLEVQIAQGSAVLSEMQQGYPARFESAAAECKQAPVVESSPVPVL